MKLSHIACIFVALLGAIVWQIVHVVIEFEYSSYSSPHSATALSRWNQLHTTATTNGVAPTFCNFDGNVCCRTSTEVQIPKSIEEVQEVVRDAVMRGSRVRVSGAGHSMSSLVCDPTPQGDSVNGGAPPLTILSLDRMQRVLDVHRLAINNDTVSLLSSPLDVTTAYVTVEAGLRLIELNRALRYLGLGLKNMGLIQEQSVAGLMATGVHGTGNRLPSIPSIVHSMDVVLANGSLVTWSRDSNPDMFRYARLHLGLFGVVVRVTLEVTDLYDLQRHNAVTTLEKVLKHMHEHQRNFRHYQFWWVPGTKYALVNAMDMVEVPVIADGGDIHLMCHVFRQHLPVMRAAQSVGLRPCKFHVDLDAADSSSIVSPPPQPPKVLTPLRKALSAFKTDLTFDIAVRLSNMFPSVGPLVLQLLPYLEPGSEDLVGWGPDILTFPGINFHAVRYTELEYFVPMKYATTAVRWFVSFAEEHRVDCPINSIDPIRTVRGDDVPLSPLYGWYGDNDNDGDNGGGIALSFVLVQRNDIFTQCASIVEAAMLKMEGRPHWGKRHPLVRTYEDVVALFGADVVDGYRAAVLDADPHGVFQTEELRVLFGLMTTTSH